MSEAPPLSSSSSSRFTAFLWVTFAYIVSLVVAVVVGYWVGDENLILQIGIADVAATVAIFAFSVFFKNSSFYDAYWSVAPMVIGAYLIFLAGETVLLRQIVVMSLVCFWGMRLTFNWARGWPGLDHEDWRYGDLAQQTGRWYWLVSFSGIHMFPTVLVFAGCLSLFPALYLAEAAPFGWIDVVATVITFGAVLIELIADNQLRSFRLSDRKPEAILQNGLWAYSRHPNYFGEIGFWVGLFLFGYSAAPSWWWTIIGPLAMIALFVGISIPMMDKRMKAKRPAYEAHCKRVSSLIPMPPRKS